MKRVLVSVFLLVLFASSACSGRRQFVVYNGCKGSWVRIREGASVLIERLEYGAEAPLETSRFVGDNGRTIELIAVGFSLRDNRPLGSATQSVYVSGRSGSVTAPSDLPTWRINYLSSSDSGGGCER